MFLERYGTVSKNIIFLTVVHHKMPYMKSDRYHVINFFKEAEKGQIVSVKLNFGFMEAVSSDAVICAGYVNEFVRYYFGSRFINNYHLDGKAAWEIRNQLLNANPPAITVSASLNDLLGFNGTKFDVRITEGGLRTE
jgi:hypothetical protein